LKRLLLVFAACALFLSVAPSSAQNASIDVVALPNSTALTQFSHEVVARVDISDQTMHVYVDNQLRYIWWVSTGLGGHRTPTGSWNAYWLSPNHRSSLYGNAPMPWSVFFNGNYAVHGTTAVDNLGQPASHGCIRLHPDHAAIFFELTEMVGLNQALVMVVD
jgi:lipoprotein-anchoring transpeptidase ErfK/SrfK